MLKFLRYNAVPIGIVSAFGALMLVGMYFYETRYGSHSPKLGLALDQNHHMTERLTAEKITGVTFDIASESDSAATVTLADSDGAHVEYKVPIEDASMRTFRLRIIPPSPTYNHPFVLAESKADPAHLSVDDAARVIDNAVTAALQKYDQDKQTQVDQAARAASWKEGS